ncbi:hypothetical protein DAPPUDRAFT_308992 [Daphnia pulex]|uniref:Uncharacterized protein n=1 Tax=Daphnia pulex TaxID=6669 RepID=E9G3H9_DAPPU|nr:hypothetical protein DAPPUDRAFT_308992 [Daphnia pulex]|eukprot:EFX85985.1 hypothetical protein DAPPUDRAFT_308992 [Daphnia pulex]
MSQMLILLVVLIGSMSAALASFNPHGQPLLSAVTSYTFTVMTTSTIKTMYCYTTEGQVTRCRRKRGIEESPLILAAVPDVSKDEPINPSNVLGVEATTAPRAERALLSALDYYNADRIFSSFDDSYLNKQNLFRQLSNRGRNNVISVGNCGMSTVNFSQFLSCLGLTVQETTTLTATFTDTSFTGTTHNTMTVKHCTPAGFPISVL